MIKSKNKFFVTYEDMNFLYQELQNTWIAYEIPSFHQEIFKSHLDFIQPGQVPHVIAKEINLIESSSSPIQKTLENIVKREYLIGKLITFKQKTRESISKDLEIIELETAYSIIKLRKTTADAMKSISHWKQQFFNLNCEFYWNQISYIEKIKHDLNFLKALGRFHFVMRDPFFLSMDYKKVSIKARVLVKLDPAQKKKLKKLEKNLNYEIPSIKTIQLTQAQVVNKDMEGVFDKKILSKVELEKLDKENRLISDEIFYFILNQIVDKEGNEVYKRQNFKKELKEIAEEFYEKLCLELLCKESQEYFLDLVKSHSEVIYNSILEECLLKFTQFCISESDFLAHNIACDLCECVNFVFLVKPCVSEIIEENNKISNEVCEGILEDILIQPWVLGEIESLLNTLKLKKQFKGVKLAEISENHKKEFDILTENTLEEICTKLIQKYPGKKWVKSIVKHSFKEVRGEDEPDYKTLLPI